MEITQDVRWKQYDSFAVRTETKQNMTSSYKGLHQTTAPLIKLLTLLLLLMLTLSSVTGTPRQESSPMPLTALNQLAMEQAKLEAKDRATDDWSGWSVALDGDTALMGALHHEVNSNYFQGAVYVFVRNGTTWTQQAKLTASDGTAVSLFGIAVALEGDTALVGASSTDKGENVNQGAAYIFVRNGTTWTQQAKLIASDGSEDDVFGSSVALSGNTALIGATGVVIDQDAYRGAAYVFIRNGTTWTQQAKLTASDGGDADTFGWSVALDGDLALIGAEGDKIGAKQNQGSAYLFKRNGSTWTQQAKLTASDGEENDLFGQAVALDGNRALIGAPRFDDHIGKQGAAYVFVRNAGNWVQEKKLTSGTDTPTDYFGSSVALEGDTAVVGVYHDDIGTHHQQGSAYLYSRSSGSWQPQQRLIASDGSGGDQMGWSAALSGDTVLIGAHLNNDEAKGLSNSGSAYVFVIADDLLFNGGFEATTNDKTVLNPWVLKSGTKDKIKCNTPEKTVAHSGQCAFVFKGGAGENSALQQSPVLNDFTPSAGAAFDFSSYINAGGGASGKIKILVKYSDGGDPGKFSANLTATDGYQPITGSIDLRTAAISKVKVQIKHSSLSGKVAIDEVSLRYVAGGGARLIDLP